MKSDPAVRARSRFASSRLRARSFPPTGRPISLAKTPGRDGPASVPSDRSLGELSGEIGKENRPQAGFLQYSPDGSRPRRAGPVPNLAALRLCDFA
jgi:hypothetical protein